MYRTILMIGLLATVPITTLAEDVSDTPDNAKKTSCTSKRGLKETLSSPTDVDVFKFQVRTDKNNPQHDTSGNVVVTLSQKPPPGTNSQSGWQLDLYSENDFANRLYTIALPETNVETEFEQGLAPGIYYYKVSSMDSNVFPAAEYTFTCLWEENANYERQPNDVPETATAIKVNEDYYGNLSSVNDIDIYRFSLQAPDSITVTLTQDIPSLDSTIGWQFGLLNRAEAAVNVPSTTQLGSQPAELDVGVYYFFVKALPSANDQEQTAPIGRRYQIKVHAPSAPTPPSTCEFAFVYAQHPQSHRWVTVSTPCDVPAGWFSQTTPPEDGEVCPSPHATYTLPSVKSDGTPNPGLVKIPLVDFTDENGNEIIARVELQQKATENEPYLFEVLLDKVRVISVEVPEIPVEIPAEIPVEIPVEIPPTQ